MIAGGGWGGLSATGRLQKKPPGRRSPWCKRSRFDEHKGLQGPSRWTCCPSSTALRSVQTLVIGGKSGDPLRRAGQSPTRSTALTPAEGVGSMAADGLGYLIAGPIGATAAPRRDGRPVNAEGQGRAEVGPWCLLCVGGGNRSAPGGRPFGAHRDTQLAGALAGVPAERSPGW